MRSRKGKHVAVLGRRNRVLPRVCGSVRPEPRFDQRCASREELTAFARSCSWSGAPSMLELLRRFRPSRAGSIESRPGIVDRLLGGASGRSYLEIGVRDRRHNFDKIKADVKHGVDPAPRRPVTHHMTSDEFFERGLASTYDVVFIDGLHLDYQVERDVRTRSRSFVRAARSCSTTATRSPRTRRPRTTTARSTGTVRCGRRGRSSARPVMI